MTVWKRAASGEDKSSDQNAARMADAGSKIAGDILNAIMASAEKHGGDLNIKRQIGASVTGITMAYASVLINVAAHEEPHLAKLVVGIFDTMAGEPLKALRKLAEKA